MQVSRKLSASKSHPSGVGDTSASEEVIDLAMLFSTLWRGKWFIAFFATLAVILGGYYAYMVATPLFRSTAVVILETNQDQIVDLQGVVGGLTGDTSEVNSEVEVLRARGLMGKVVDRLKLEDDPEFNTALQMLTPFDAMIEGAKTSVKSMLGLSTEVADLSPEEAAQATRDAVVSKVIEAVSIRNVPASLVFQVTVETEDAQKSALIADTLVDLYILNQIEVKFEATEQATVWLSERVSELQMTLESAEAEVAAFTASNNLVSLEGMQALERQLKELRDRISSAQMTRIAAAASLADLENAGTRTAKAALADDAQLTRLGQRVQSDATLGPVFDARFELVLNRKIAEVARTEQQANALVASEAELTAELDRQGEDLIVLQQLTREAEATRVLYEYFLTRFNETSAQQGIQQADSRILSNAVVPRAPSEPRKPLLLAISGMLGLMFGTGFVLLRETRNNGFRTARDLEQITGYTVLGQIPTMPSSRRRKVLTYLADKPTSAAAEAYRNLRTSLMLSQIDNPPKVIMMTSSVPGEGKTTNSLALAQNLLGMGKKVLLVEGDIRRRTLLQYFDNVPDRGIVAVLSGDMTLSEAVFRSPELGADILGGEPTRTNAADLFSSDAFQKFLTDARAAYDAIIIDTPPILVVPDARIIAEHVDAVIFTVRWDATSKPQVEESLRLFHTVGQRVTGLVLSQINSKGMKRYGYGGLHGSYSSYGSKYYTD